MRWANVINALVGIWFIIAPFVLKYDDMRYAVYASIVGGALLLVLVPHQLDLPRLPFSVT